MPLMWSQRGWTGPPPPPPPPLCLCLRAIVGKSFDGCGRGHCLLNRTELKRAKERKCQCDSRRQLADQVHPVSGPARIRSSLV